MEIVVALIIIYGNTTKFTPVRMKFTDKGFSKKNTVSGKARKTTLAIAVNAPVNEENRPLLTLDTAGSATKLKKCHTNA